MNEDQFVERLAAYDDALMRGTPIRGDGITDCDTRLADAAKCVELLNRVWPASSPGTQSIHEGPWSSKLDDLRLIREIGRGGMGVVFEAEQLSLGRRVAVKVLPYALLLDPKSQQRFRNEVRAAAALDHPHIVAVYSTGEGESSHYYTMQLVEGPTLAEVIAFLQGNTPKFNPHLPIFVAPNKCVTRQLPLSPYGTLEFFRTVARWGVQACQALQHAHDVGILHRDIKPGNLMLADVDRLMVTDFGLARIGGGGGLTLTGDIVGTLRYMAPEQALARRVVLDNRADLYSLGATLYEALTLRPVFEESDRTILLNEIAFHNPLPLRKLEPRVPQDLQTIVLKALTKTPADRYETAEAMASDLQAFLERRPIAARPSSVSRRAWQWCRRHRQVAAFSAVLLGILLLASSVSTWQAVRATHAESHLRNVLVSEQQATRAALDSQRLAEVRLADSLISAGDAAAALGQASARIQYQEARRLAQKLGLSELPANTGLLASYATQTAPLNLEGRDPSSTASFGNDSHQVRILAITPDGASAVIAGGNGGLALWDLATGICLRSFDESQQAVSTIAISPDGKLVVAGRCDNSISLWDFATGKLVKSLEGHTQCVTGIRFSPDSKHLASASNDRTVRLWDVDSAIEIHCFRSPSYVASVAFTPDGHSLVTSGEPDVVIVWNLESKQQTLKIAEGSGSSVTAVAVTPNGQSILSGGLSHQLILWDLHTGKRLMEFLGHTAAIHDVAISPDGSKALSVSSDRTVRLWDISSGKQLAIFTGHRSEIRSCAITPDGQFALTGDQEGQVNFWSLQKNSDVLSFGGHTARIPSVVTSADGRLLLSGSFDETACLWDVATGKKLRRLSTSHGPIWGVALHRDNHLAISTHEDGTAVLWDLATGEVLHKLVGHQNIVTAATFTPDGRTVLTAGKDGTLRQWDVATGKLQRTTHGQHATIRALAVLPDGRSVIGAAFDYTMIQWDLSSGKEIHIFHGHHHWVQSLALSQDGTLLASGSWDHAVGLWDVNSGKNLSIANAATDVVTGVSLSPDAQLLLTGSLDGTVRLWDLNSHQPGREITLSSDGITCVLFDYDGQAAFVASRTGSLTRWQLNRPAKYEDFEVALAEARRKLATNPCDEKSLAMFGAWYQFRRIPSLALKFYERARDAGDHPSALEIARCHWLLGRFAEARAAFDSAVKQKEAPSFYLDLCRYALDTEIKCDGHRQ